MRLLLDTHIWIWAETETQKLRPAVAAALANPENELWLSPISFWEVLLLDRKGRIRLAPSPVEWIRRVLATGTYQEAAVNFETSLALNDLLPAHMDPADAFLAATAKVFDLTLVTADARLMRAKACKVLANRGAGQP